MGVVIAQSGIGAEEATAGEAPAEPQAAVTSGDAITLSAANIQFNATELTMPAKAEVSVTLQNEDTAPHNFAMYESEQDGAAQENPIFQGENIDGGDSIEYPFTSPAKGEYYFQCDVHPAMNGRVVVE